MGKEQELRLDPVALEAARRATGTIPGAAYWDDCARIITAYLAALPSDEQAEVVGDREVAKMPETAELTPVVFRTASEIEQERLSRKRASPPAVAAGGVTVTDAMADAALAKSTEKALNTLTNTAAMKEIIRAALAVRDEGIRSDDLVTAVWELLQTVHQPTPTAGSDYWHVTAGKHVEFGKLITKLHSLLALPTPPSRGEGV